jgi:hypothetical protein
VHQSGDDYYVAPRSSLRQSSGGLYFKQTRRLCIRSPPKTKTFETKHHDLIAPAPLAPSTLIAQLPQLSARQIPAQFPNAALFTKSPLVGDKRDRLADGINHQWVLNCYPELHFYTKENSWPCCGYSS